MKTFATLGGVKFELAAPEQIDETSKWEYKPQETVAAVAVIQFAGTKPRELNIAAKLHSTFCNPEERLQEFKDKAKKIAPLPLIYANGKLVGFFVIEEIKASTLQTDDMANVISMDLSLKLIEASGTAEIPPVPAQTKTNDLKKAGTVASVPTAGGISVVAPLSVPTNIEAIAAVMKQQQQKITGVLPTIDQALRKATG